MPGQTTVYRWLKDNEEFRKKYARAREEQADHYAEEIVAIADEDPATAIQRQRGGEETIVIDGAAVAHQRLRVDARKWFASKVAPKKYGDRLDLEHTGPGGGPIQTVTSQMSPEHAAQVYRKLMDG